MTVEEMKEEARKNGDKEIDDCCQIKFLPPSSLDYGPLPQTRYEPRSLPALVIDDQGRVIYRPEPHKMQLPRLVKNRHDKHLGGVEEY